MTIPRRTTFFEGLDRSRRSMIDGTLGGGVRSATPFSPAPIGGSQQVIAPDAGPESAIETLALVASSQTIDSGGDYITWSFERSGALHTTVGWISYASLPSDTVTVARTGRLAIDLWAVWDTFTDGGTLEVEVTRGSVTYTWTFPGLTAAGQQFSDTTHLNVQAGDTLKIKLTQSSGSAKTLDTGEMLLTLWPTSVDTAVPCLEPSSLSGLFLHLDADRLTVGDGNPVATWSDLSGNSRDFTQATGANQPTLREGHLNGRHGVEFDGTDDFMTSGTAFFDADGVVHTMFAVVRHDDAANEGALLGVLDGVTGDGTQDLGWHWRMLTDGRHQYVHQSGAGTGGANEVEVFGSGTIGQAMVAHASRTLSEVRAGTGGATQETETYPDYDPAGDGDTWLGRTETGGGVTWLDGFVYEVVAYDRVLDGEEVRAVACWLADKWGL